MKRLHKVNIPIYCGELLVLYSKDFTKDGRRFGLDISIAESRYLGLAIRLRDRKYNRYLVLINRNTHNIIAHECLHVVNFILYDHGITIDTKNDEVQAYLLSWVVKQCYKARRKVKN